MREAAWGPVWQGNPFAPIRIATCACERKRGLAANPRSPIHAHVNTPLTPPVTARRACDRDPRGGASELPVPLPGTKGEIPCR